MFPSRSAGSVSQAHPVRVKSMSILAKLLTPKPKMQLDGPQTAYIRRKARSRPVRLNPVQIANERRFVQGLGYIRADATPYRWKAAKERGPTDLSAVEGGEVFQWPLVAPSQVGGTTSTRVRYNKWQGLYEEPRYPTNYIPWPTTA